MAFFSPSIVATPSNVPSVGSSDLTQSSFSPRINAVFNRADSLLFLTEWPLIAEIAISLQNTLQAGEADVKQAETITKKVSPDQRAAVNNLFWLIGQRYRRTPNGASVLQKKLEIFFQHQPKTKKATRRQPFSLFNSSKKRRKRFPPFHPTQIYAKVSKITPAT